MGKFSQEHNKPNKQERLVNKKRKEELRSQQARGLSKKVNPKEQSLPNLKHLKDRMVGSLKLKKTNTARDNLIKRLEQDNDYHIQDFIPTFEPVQEVEEEYNGDIQVDNIRQGKKYHKEIKKVIESCDILVQILDARDPLATRCRNIEHKILGMDGNKKIILLLNKIDLVPIENAYAWQNYLRREYPTVLFKANLQNQQTNLSSNVLFKKSMHQNIELAGQMINSSKAVGPDHLMQLIKQLSKIDGVTRAVTVGLIGYPNVGKSSVINSLKRVKTCQVSSIAGSTKSLQEVKLDSQVKLLDCPGVIFQMSDKTNLILRNTLKLGDDLEDIVTQILKKVSEEDIMELYGVQPFKSTIDFLVKLSRKTGRLSKGGIADMKASAKLVVEDWNKGRIKYFTNPPSIDVSEMVEE